MTVWTFHKLCVSGKGQFSLHPYSLQNHLSPGVQFMVFFVYLDDSQPCLQVLSLVQLKHYPLTCLNPRPAT